MKLLVALFALLIVSLIPVKSTTPVSSNSCSAAEGPCTCIPALGDYCQPDSGIVWDFKCRE
ncbi:MAG: hypothetical protein RIE53_00025 [Rhodothermales bacterium]